MSNALVPIAETLGELTNAASCKLLASHQVVEAYNLAAAAEGALKAIKANLKAEHRRRADETGRLTTSSGSLIETQNKPSQSVTDAVRASELLDPLVTRSEFNACVSISLSKLAQIIGYSRFLECVSALEDAGLIEVKEGAKQLRFKAF